MVHIYTIFLRLIEIIRVCLGKFYAQNLGPQVVASGEAQALLPLAPPPCHDGEDKLMDQAQVQPALWAPRRLLLQE